MMKKIVNEMNKMTMVEATVRDGYIFAMIWDESTEIDDNKYWEEIDKINEIIREANKNEIRVRTYWESEDE